MDRAALQNEREELQRKADRRRGVPGYGANVQALDDRISAIDVQLAQPEEPAERVVSLAGQALGDKTASPRERSLAARVLSQSDDD